ncbi:MAG: rod shape-determining protein RodA [Eggerthellaceae bacterium]|nr:rod shape-determining protein RodA [Eggerthellaceae bacterium]
MFEPTSTLRFGRRLHLAPVNRLLVQVLVLLVGLGLITVYSAVLNNDNYNFSRQLFGVALGILIMIAIWQFDYRILGDMTYLFLASNVVLILSPLIPGLGAEINGSRSWIRLPFIGLQVQPSEAVKITYLLLAASLMSRYNGVLDDPYEYLKSVFILGIPFACIMLQPDLGTGLVYLVIAAMALLMGGARPRFLLLTVLAGVVLILLVLGVDELTKYKDASGEWEYRILKGYQRQRLIVFLNPEGDTSASGYNLRQAQIAIGSGGVLGKGLTQGTQASLGFLPEYPTDFIFCVLAEERGFVGTVFLLVLYIALIVICIRISKNAPDLFGMLIVMCTVAMWLFQILENIGMTLGLMPITGIPLPFMSYGSSFMVVNFVMLGFIGSVWGHSTVHAKRS